MAVLSGKSLSDELLKAIRTSRPPTTSPQAATSILFLDDCGGGKQATAFPFAFNNVHCLSSAAQAPGRFDLER